MSDVAEKPISLRETWGLGRLFPGAEGNPEHNRATSLLCANFVNRRNHPGLRADESQMSRDASLIVLNGHIESCLSVIVSRRQACATFQKEFHYCKRRVSLAGFMQRRVAPLISYVYLSPLIHQPICSDEIALVCERVQQRATSLDFIDVDARI